MDTYLENVVSARETELLASDFKLDLRQTAHGITLNECLTALLPGTRRVAEFLKSLRSVPCVSARNNAAACIQADRDEKRPLILCPTSHTGGKAILHRLR
jgi:hypothetical protein